MYIYAPGMPIPARCSGLLRIIFCRAFGAWLRAPTAKHWPVAQTPDYTGGDYPPPSPHRGLVKPIEVGPPVFRSLRTARWRQSAYPDSGVQIWDVAEAQVITHLKHVGIDWAYSTTFSPNGKMLASAADDGQIRIWDTSTWALLSVLKGHMGGIMALQYSPSGKLLASGGQDNTIRLWDAERLEFLCALGGHADAVECLIFNPEGTRLMSSGKDQLIRVWGKEN